MTNAIERDQDLLKGEGLLLNAVCVVMALLFLGLAGLSYLSAGNFISTDNLFFTTVSGMMALIFLVVPLSTLREARKAKKAPAKQLATTVAGRGALASRTAAGALRSPVRYADTVDARGRPIPPDVARMVEFMKERETNAP